MKTFELVSANTFEAAARVAAGTKAADVLVKAGGIDLLDRMKERLDMPLRVLNIKPIAAESARAITESKDGSITIGALATLTQIAENATIQRMLAGLAKACGDAATPQVRNVATLGGNLCQKPRCWYYRNHDIVCFKKGGDTCYSVFGDNRYHAVVGTKSCHIVNPSNAALPLAAANATVVVIKFADGKVTERTVSMDDFYHVPDDPKDNEHTLANDELVREVRIPASAMGTRTSYLEIREKHSFDWPLVSCSVNLNDKTAPRVVLGAVAPIPWRLKAVEEKLAGKELTDKLVDECAAIAAEGMESMSCNGFKLPMVGVIVKRALNDAASRGK